LRTQSTRQVSPAKRTCPASRRVHDIHVIDGGVHYARNGDVRLAYRVLGDGDTTLVWVPG